MSQKWCSGCKREKPIFEFGKNRTTKDSLQKWCKMCMRDAMSVRRSNASSLSAKQIKGRLKMQEFGKALIRHRGIGYKAYKEISNCKTDSSAASSCSVYLRKTNFPSQFTEYLKSSEILEPILAYYKEAMENGTLTEKRDAVRIVTQINGLWKEDSGRQSPQEHMGVSRDERERNIRAMWVLVTTGHKMVDDNGGYFKEPPPMPSKEYLEADETYEERRKYEEEKERLKAGK